MFFSDEERWIHTKASNVTDEIEGGPVDKIFEYKSPGQEALFITPRQKLFSGWNFKNNQAIDEWIAAGFFPENS